MPDLDILKKRGITEDSLKRKLEVDSAIPLPIGSSSAIPAGEPNSDEYKLGKLVLRVRSRIQEGMSRNFQDFQLYYALDRAWETPLRQVPNTLVQQFVNADANDERVYQAFNDWGLTHMIEERPDPKAPGKKIKTFNLPTFFQVFVPLVKSYVTIRWAKIMNDRRVFPFFKFEPAKQTSALSMICEALTDRVQVISSQYGYFDVVKQAVLKMLVYSQCFLFPRTPWHWEEQYKTADKTDVLLKKKKAKSQTTDKPEGEVASVGDTIKETTSEGIYYHAPHPTRTFYDLAHGPYTFNYGTHGCEYAGYWRIARYREILGGNYWNKERIALGAIDLIGSHQLFFNTVYSACTLKMGISAPAQKKPEGPQIGAELGIGTTSTDRERQIANQYYGTEHGDQGVLVTEYFERLIPSENGLGDYDCPVWFKFVIASDSATILHAEPVPYCPVIYFGYDADESRSKNASLALEVLPFQDHFSNMLSQTILTCKQNLANIAFIDEDQLMTGDDAARNTARQTIDKIQNVGEGLYRTINLFAYSSKKMQRMQLGRQGMPDVVQSFGLPKGNVQELTNVLKTILDILERVLVMSSQEIAQAASHELRVDEVRNISESTSSRLMFTATPVDIALEAMKRQNYQGLMAYGDDDIWVQIPSDNALTDEQLQAMGFTIHKKDLQTERDRYYIASINKDSTAVPLWSFAATRYDSDRVDGVKIAQAMASLIQPYLMNPMTAQAIGPEQAIEIANQIAHLAGLPRDFKLRNTGPSTAEAQQAQAQQQLQSVVQTVMQSVQGEITPLLDVVKNTDSRLQYLFNALKIPIPNPKDDITQPQRNGAGTSPGAARVATPAGGEGVPAAP